ncbi:MAG TPA: glycosyltransferase family 2 protein [Vicinamibacterales bacterium]|jgi:glycosyltransferase involved in cell wall biosynthesis
MTLDVILPTFNREALLARTLDSLHAARVPQQLEVRVLVVDNASTDGTRALVKNESGRFGTRLQYLFVPAQGKPHALNAGIAATDGDLIGLIDDDEEIDGGWFECVQNAFVDDAGSRDRLDFIGGKVLPRWDAPAPSWMGDGYRGVIGWVDPGASRRIMDASYPGILMGGNAVIRRSALEQAGPYSTALNRTGARLLGCEDEDMYHRLLARGARGQYRPDLIVHHHVPADRLTKKYFRRWCFWRGVSLGIMDRDRPAPVAYLAGVPRYRIGRALRGLGGTLAASSAAERFEHELAWWDLAGMLWGKHVYRPNAQSTAPHARRGENAVDGERLV